MIWTGVCMTRNFFPCSRAAETAVGRSAGKAAVCLWAAGVAVLPCHGLFAQSVRTAPGETGAVKIESGGRSSISMEGVGGVDSIGMDRLGQYTPRKPASGADAAYPSAVTLRPVHPSKVREMAAGLAREKYANKVEQDAFAEAFQEGFKSVLAAPNETVAVKAGQAGDPTAAGFALGCNTAVSNAAALGITLEDYGYVYTNAIGHVYLGFEQREFRPLGGSQVWWLAHDPELGRQYSVLAGQGGKKAADRKAVRASLLGYLSPPARLGYGHFSRYPRELVVRVVLDLKLEGTAP